MSLVRLKAKHRRQLDALKKRQLDELRAARLALRPAPGVSSQAGRRPRPGEVDALLQQARSTVSGGLWSMFGGR